MIEICKMGQKTGMGKFIHKKTGPVFHASGKKGKKKRFFHSVF